MILHLLTDAEARALSPADYEEVPADRDCGAGALSSAVLHRLAEVGSVLADDAELQVMRDWEGCLVAYIPDVPEHLGVYGVLALTGDGRIGEGGVNLPRYFDSFAAMLAYRR